MDEVSLDALVIIACESVIKFCGSSQSMLLEMALLRITTLPN